MKKTIMVMAAVAGMALTAVGQSENKQEPKKSDGVTSPRDVASGQASGRKGNWDIKKQEGGVQDEAQANGRKGNWNIKELKGAVTDDSQASDKKGKTAAADDWQSQTGRESPSGKASGKLQNTSQEQPSSVSTARETGSGMATGKRQQADKQSDQKPKK